MKQVGRALLTGILLCAYGQGTPAQVSPEAVEAFDQRYWRTAIELLQSQGDTPEATRLLGLAYFHIMDLDQAAPWLEKALSAAPDDRELNSALLEVHLATRQYGQADERARKLASLGATDIAEFAEARIELAQPEGDRDSAKAQLLQIFERGNPELELRAADQLIEAHLTDGELGSAYAVARMALGRHPDPANAIRYEPFIPESQVGGEFGIDVGYRLEFDDNVTFPDEAFGSGEEDFRHILMADVHYERPLHRGWEFYARGSLLQSLHHDLNRFDLTRLNLSAAIGQTGKKSGWRLPIEVGHDRLDGHSFRTSLAAVPGYYMQFGEDLFSHVYARLQQDDFQDFTHPDEDRSGDVMGFGLLLAGQVSPRLGLRSYFELNEYDTDGLYWERDETVLFLHGEFEISSNWVAGLAFRFKKEDFDNPRPGFANVQEDESTEFFFNLTHKFAGNWRWRGQLSVVDHESNIPIFDYERNVYSFAVTREF